MINSKFLRKNIKKIALNLSKKGFFLDIKKFKKLEKKRKNIQFKTENLRSIQKNNSKFIGNIKNSIKDQKKIIQKNILLSKKLNKYKKKFKTIKKKIYDFSVNLPNITLKDVPFGQNSHDNKIIYTWGKIKKQKFLIKNHLQLGKKINGFDWKTSAKISGTNFFIMKGIIAKLYRILGQFMLDIHIKKHKYKEIYVPYIVNEECLYGTGQLPKFHSNLFGVYTTKEKKLKKNFLIPTAEVPLTNLVQNKILKKSKLPYMFVAKTPCFRSESNSYGRDFQGLIRLNQFDKVELVHITHPKKSCDALEKITLHAEKILKLLKLPYRKILLCTGETNFSSAKTYDLEVWFPSHKSYIEVSSCSNMLDFQAQRIQARYFSKKNNKYVSVHTLNGSGLAIGRILAAILENYQLQNGAIKIPKILRKKYMNGLKLIS
ncbi:serine--tRNA ligase [Buchnera aphidicola]|uniref:serine--tRNA ligase n=1 Tax=Buchnera aphidicola TaxID=9 RepID=UPI002238E8E3|nr:serine--tRNA ligase [Buchnera aphidicola]MCW5197713.1 serine--tRNA ligase [Buchnera aphidicola (Chaitophorus viminalis)]